MPRVRWSDGYFSRRVKKIDLIKIREDLHKIPEQGLQEKLTQAYLLKVLGQFSCLKLRFLGTGILAEYTQGQGKYKLFRADMDGLQVDEQTRASFASQHSGWMHACGHDIHMSVLLGLIQKVEQNRLKKNLLFLFQPAEELGLGAKKVISSGVLKDYEIEAVFALHITPDYAVGQVASKAGTIFAAAQEFDFDIVGKGAHAAKPQQGRDALLAGCELVQLLQRLKEKSNRICVGEFASGSVRNAIAQRAIIKGTHRSLCKQDKIDLNKHLEASAQEVAQRYGVKIDLRFGASTTEVVNHKELLAKMSRSLPQGVEFKKAPVEYTAEDFGVLSSIYPGLLFWLGGGVSRHGLHNGKFLPDSKAIAVGVESFYCLI